MSARPGIHVVMSPEQKKKVEQLAEMFDISQTTFVLAVVLGASKGVTRSLEAQVHAGLSELAPSMSRRAPRQTRQDEWVRTVPGQMILNGYILKKDPERLKDMHQTWKLRRPDGSVEDTGCTNQIDAMAYAVAIMSNEQAKKQEGRS